MTNKFSFISAVLFVFLGVTSEAASFKALVKSSGYGPLSVQGQIKEVYETKSSFFIAVSDQTAFFRFKKNQSSDASLRSFLNHSQKTKKQIQIEYDIFTSEILEIQD